jgi:hypothetical protein
MIVSLVPETITALMTDSAQIFSDFWVLIALAIGVIIGFYILEETIGLFKFANGDENDEYYEDDDGNVYGKLPQFVVDAWKRDGKL